MQVSAVMDEPRKYKVHKRRGRGPASKRPALSPRTREDRPPFSCECGPTPQASRVSGGQFCNDIDALGPRNGAYLIVSECIHHTRRNSLVGVIQECIRFGVRGPHFARITPRVDKRFRTVTCWAIDGLYDSL